MPAALTAHTNDLTRMRRWLLALSLAGAVTTVCAAAGPVGDPAWEGLSAAQQQVLAPLKADWPQLGPNRRAKWLEIAARYPAMPADKKQRIQERMADWARMSPEERGQARSNFQEARRLSHDERREQWEAYKALPKESKEALAARANRPASATSQSTSSVHAQPLDAQAPKSNIVNPATRHGLPPKSVAPAMVQAGPGATTSLVATPTRPPSHLQTGKPKIDAAPGTLNRSTLLPKTYSPAAASAASAVVVPR